MPGGWSWADVRILAADRSSRDMSVKGTYNNTPASHSNPWEGLGKMLVLLRPAVF